MGVSFNDICHLTPRGPIQSDMFRNKAGGPNGNCQESAQGSAFNRRVSISNLCIYVCTLNTLRIC